MTSVRPLRLLNEELLCFYEEIPPRLLRMLFVYNLDAAYNSLYAFYIAESIYLCCSYNDFWVLGDFETDVSRAE